MASNEAVYSDLSHSLLSMCSALLSDIEEGRHQTLLEGSSHVAQYEASQPQNRDYDPELGGIEVSHSGRDKVHVLDNTGYEELGQENPAHDEVSHLGNLLSNEPDGIPSSCFSDTSSKPTILGHSSAPSASGVKTVSAPSCDEGKSQTDVKFICRECGKRFNYQRFYREHCRIHTGERPLECKYCGKSFRRSNALYVHERVHTREKRYSCQICEKTFGRSDTLKTHIRTHTGEKPYKCSFCDCRFNQRNGRILHEKGHKNDKIFTCDECGMKFRQKFGLQNHQRASVVARKCTECGKVCPNLCTLRVHRQQLHNKKLYSCDQCGTSFATERKLGKHFPCSSSSNQTVFVCKQCARAFDNLQDLGSHECSKIYRSSFTCDVCEQKFSSIEDLKTHRLGHSKKKVFQCSHCDMVFKAKRNLLRHTPLHAMLRNGSLCPSNPIDGETSSNEVAEVSANPTISDLVNRNNSVHGQTELYSNNGAVTNEEQQQTSCTTLYDINISNDQSLQSSSKAPVIPLYPHPGSLSNKSSAIDLHLQNRSSAIVNTDIRENAGEKTPCPPQAFVCSDCGKSFGKRRSYTAHQRIHRPVCPHKCKFCGMGFKQALTLTHHVRKHTGEKPFICEVCNKCFIRSDGLRSHMLIHTGSKPYKCMFCEEWFDQRSSRAVHEKAHDANGVTLCKSSEDLEEICSSFTLSHPDVCLQSLDKETGEKAPTQAQIFVCLECGKVFKKRHSYTAHLRTHSPKRPHECKFCEKSFRQSTALRHHVRKHTGEKPFACLICKKNFSRSDSLRTHMFIHTGTKPYKCKFCDTWFNQRGSRYSHEMVHCSNKKPICC